MKRCLVLLASAWVAACSAGPKVVKPPPGAYGDALGKATRSAAIYDGFESKLFLIATHESAEFQKARAAELARTYAEPAESSVVRVRPLADAADGPAFVVVTSAPDAQSAALDGPSPAWAVRLLGSNGPILPDSVTRVDLADAVVTGLFPWAVRPWVAYRVVFPSGPTNAPVLLVSGPAGSTKLAF